MSGQHTDLPLFAWQPSCKLIAFPLSRRTGKVRDVARKMIEKSTDRHAAFYQRQVTEALIGQLERIGVPESQQNEQINAFWKKVEIEMARLCYRGAGNNDPRGAA